MYLVCILRMEDGYIAERVCQQEELCRYRCHSLLSSAYPSQTHFNRLKSKTYPPPPPSTIPVTQLAPLLLTLWTMDLPEPRSPLFKRIDLFSFPSKSWLVFSQTNCIRWSNHKLTGVAISVKTFKETWTFFSWPLFPPFLFPILHLLPSFVHVVIVIKVAEGKLKVLHKINKYSLNNVYTPPSIQKLLRHD